MYQSYTERKGNVKDSKVGKFHKGTQNDAFPKYCTYEHTATSHIILESEWKLVRRGDQNGMADRQREIAQPCQPDASDRLLPGLGIWYYLYES